MLGIFALLFCVVLSDSIIQNCADFNDDAEETFETKLSLVPHTELDYKAAEEIVQNIGYGSEYVWIRGRFYGKINMYNAKDHEKLYHLVRCYKIWKLNQIADAFGEIIEVAVDSKRLVLSSGKLVGYNSNLKVEGFPDAVTGKVLLTFGSPCVSWSDSYQEFKVQMNVNSKRYTKYFPTLKEACEFHDLTKMEQNTRFNVARNLNFLMFPQFDFLTENIEEKIKELKGSNHRVLKDRYRDIKKELRSHLRDIRLDRHSEYSDEEGLISGM